MILKKNAFIVLASIMLITLSTAVLAEDTAVEIKEGMLSKNRVLIPLRVVSNNFGGDVKWYKDDKYIRIKTDEKEIFLAVNFKNARVNDQVITMDSSVVLIGSTAYVPLRFVSQTLGAELNWDGENKQATIMLDDQTVVVNVQNDDSQIPVSQKISQTRINLLSKKLNETSNLSEINPIRTYFKPYFTEKLIQSIIKGQELQSEWIQYDIPENSVYYTSSTTGTLSQSYVLGNTLTGESHYVNDRNIELVYSEGVWKVNRIKFVFRMIPNLGYDR
ncbi:copper amine oxidase N-terminal domain-containing protein [Paenibacillus xylanilyticus]|uniref:Copper amine oxidase N-terminal domain-containing protein n=1 Tax=Paenibacillus xylanilyticus TaxID=248903 RepID=A0A7Y6BXG8_9BACL|nr:copper amine oxidase N-terminal domain-containing protein [Paenibacillus xylanilyticus]NUU76712.1 copper amine oxidase N-terminal domain-containing protein [Paenibacillus xylanilyticus]